MSIKRLLEETGLDWLRYVLSGANPSCPSPPEDRAALAETFQKYSDDALQEMVESCQALYDETEERIQRIEAKSGSLMGFTGAGLALSAGLAANLLDPKRVIASFARPTLAIVFVIVSASFFVALVLLSRVLDVHRYKHTALSRGTAREMKEIRIERAVSLCYAQSCNDNVAREKATLLGGGQLLFRNGVVALFALSLGYFLPADVAPISPSATTQQTNGSLDQIATPLRTLDLSPNAPAGRATPMVTLPDPPTSSRTSTVVAQPGPSRSSSERTPAPENSPSTK